MLNVCRVFSSHRILVILTGFLLVAVFVFIDTNMLVCKRTEINVSSEQKYKFSGRMFIDKKNHLLYCSVPKIGSTFMKRLLLILSGKMNKSSIVEIKTKLAHKIRLENVNILDINSASINGCFANFHKLLVVRNPYERLYSAYLDKFVRPNGLYYKLGKKIIKMFRSNPSSQSLSCGDDVTFPEFIKYFIYSLQTGNLTDPHFIPIHMLCQPCLFDYKVIRLEDISVELPKFLHSIGINFISPSDYLKETRLLDEAKHIEYLFERNSPLVKNCLSSTEVLRRLWKRDQIRGFIKMNYSFPLEDVLLPHLPKSQIFKMFFSYYQMSYRKDRRASYRTAMLAAYSQLSPRDFQLTQQYLETDCKLFGYKSLQMEY
ncbi:carbohydrate sulfotransferase 11-like isoform X1 [Octopus vulgaris]|uniref:Carbohydrate sulfotransferase n=1 Tax=Octopus vulgaris TaxID=6645 RepID=A0AA36F7I8_OCTVU|nr:carbohydrate sulfotransferase 11-like isoform X1 [Octopus vulgaris]